PRGAGGRGRAVSGGAEEKAPAESQPPPRWTAARHKDNMRPLRWMRAALLLCAAAAACRFSVVGLDNGGGDMAVGGDLGPSGDMAGCMCATGCSDSPTHCLALQPSGPVTAADYGMSGLGAL